MLNVRREVIIVKPEADINKNSRVDKWQSKNDRSDKIAAERGIYRVW